MLRPHRGAARSRSEQSRLDLRLYDLNGDRESRGAVVIPRRPPPFGGSQSAPGGPSFDRERGHRRRLRSTPKEQRIGETISETTGSTRQGGNAVGKEEEPIAAASHGVDQARCTGGADPERLPVTARWEKIGWHVRPSREPRASVCAELIQGLRSRNCTSGAHDRCRPWKISQRWRPRRPSAAQRPAGSPQSRCRLITLFKISQDEAACRAYAQMKGVCSLKSTSDRMRGSASL
jgi:hypothetical protein